MSANEPLTLIGPAPKDNAPVNVIDPAFFYEVSQFAHAGVAGLIYLSIGHIAQKHNFFHWYWYGALIGLGVVAAAVKEFYYDPRFENEATRGSDLEDFSFYMLGILISQIVLWL
jgi:hypothetical protein